jgi:hypothetical protein
MNAGGPSQNEDAKDQTLESKEIQHPHTPHPPQKKKK